MNKFNEFRKNVATIIIVGVTLYAMSYGFYWLYTHEYYTSMTVIGLLLFAGVITPSNAPNNK